MTGDGAPRSLDVGERDFHGIRSLPLSQFGAALGPCIGGVFSPSAGRRNAGSIMTDSGPSRTGFSLDIEPHAYDPAAHPELFAGVLMRRIVAFVIDVVIIALPLFAVSIFIFILGFFTFGLGWLLFWLLSPAWVIWALVYYGVTLGGPESATIGMRAMGLQMRTWYGAPAYFVLGAVHAVVFWVSVSLLTPFILLVGLFNARRRLLHDMLVGTIVVNHPSRAISAWPPGPRW
jgi:uncharacterized RDD family membrane protein YckC